MVLIMIAIMEEFVSEYNDNDVFNILYWLDCRM